MRWEILLERSFKRKVGENIMDIVDMNKWVKMDLVIFNDKNLYF